MEKIVLFDGSRESLLANWTQIDGTPANWICDGSAMTVNRGNIVSKVTFGDAHIHLEWREPDMPWTTGQFKGKALAVVGGRDGVILPESIRRYGACMPDCRVVEKPTLDHGLGGDEHAETVREIVDFLRK